MITNGSAQPNAAWNYPLLITSPTATMTFSSRNWLSLSFSTSLSTKTTLEQSDINAAKHTTISTSNTSREESQSPLPSAQQDVSRLLRERLVHRLRLRLEPPYQEARLPCRGLTEGWGLDRVVQGECQRCADENYYRYAMLPSHRRWDIRA